jgi:hypothetical protein
VARRARAAVGWAAVVQRQRPDAGPPLVQRRRPRGPAKDRPRGGRAPALCATPAPAHHAVALAREGVPLIVIQRQLGRSNLGIPSVYLQGIDIAEIIDTIHARRADDSGQRLATALDRQPTPALLLEHRDSGPTARSRARWSSVAALGWSTPPLRALKHSRHPLMARLGCFADPLQFVGKRIGTACELRRRTATSLLE